MQRLIEKYNFKKFIECFRRQDRTVAKWDEKRTDQDVFVRRTLDKWFSGKYFHLVIEKNHYNSYNMNDAYTSKQTMYAYICRIRFAYAAYHDQIIVHYIHPHSTEVEVISLQYNEWNNYSIQEDKESFIILQKFYPFEKTKLELQTPEMKVFMEQLKQKKKVK